MDEPQSRKLAAIMFTDMVGYTASMQRNEALAIELLEVQRRLLRPLFSAHRGKEINVMGDGFLVEFASALEAARCAVAIQKAARERNATEPEEKRFQLRIGLHVGDVVVRENDVFGDGVNIASRIQPLAESGGICLSEDVARQVQNKLELPVVSLGARELKGIEIPVEVYRVALPWEEDGKATATSSPPGAVSRAQSRSAGGTLVRRAWPVAVAILATVILLIGLNVGGLRDRLVGSVAPGKITSIAVLPLENMMGDAEQDYFVEGMHDALITELSKISALKVISRTSTMQYQGTRKPVPVIARELGVDAVIAGSVLRAEDTVRITAQLIDGRTDRNLWAASFDRELKDILTLHSDVARAIAREIRIAVTPEEASWLADTRPVNPEAYQLWLKGSFHLKKLTEENFRKALEHYQQAAEIAPDYAPAHTGVAFAYLGLGGWHSSLPPEAVHSKAKEAALKALELDETLAEAHIALGRIEQLFEWDWIGANISFQRGVELSPSSAGPRTRYANYLTAMGRFEESIEIGKRTVEIDPLSPMSYNELGYALQFAGRYDEALEKYQKGLEFDPYFPLSHMLLAFLYVETGRQEEAMKQIEKIPNLSVNLMSPAYIGWLGYIYGRAGRRAEALNLLGMLKERAEKKYTPAATFANIYVGLGETEQALSHLEKAYEEHEILLVWLKNHPIYDSLRADPRFQSLLRRMNFPEN